MLLNSTSLTIPLAFNRHFTSLPIQDKYRDLYPLDVYQYAHVFHADLTWRGTAIGQMQWLFSESKEIELGNIEIFEQLNFPRNGLFWQQSFRRPKRSFLQLGLGSAMLKFLIALAEEFDVNGIAGFITQEDLQKSPFLVGWYTRHGFIVNMLPGSQVIDKEILFYRRIRTSLSGG